MAKIKNRDALTDVARCRATEDFVRLRDLPETLNTKLQLGCGDQSLDAPAAPAAH